MMWSQSLSKDMLRVELGQINLGQGPLQENLDMLCLAEAH